MHRRLLFIFAASVEAPTAPQTRFVTAHLRLRHRLVCVAGLALLGSLGSGPALASDTPTGCASLRAAQRDACVLDSTLGSSLALPLRTATGSSHTGYYRQSAAGPASFVASGFTSGMLDGSRYAGAPEVVFNTGQGWGSYWTPLHTVSPVVSPSVTTSAAQTKRTLDVEMFGTADNQVLLTEVDLTGVCSPIAQPVVENCSDPLRETLVAPASGQFFWNFGWHNQHWTGSLRLPFVITDKQFAVVGGNTSRVVSSKTDTGVWSISAVRTTRGWNVTSSWSTDAHGSHTTHLSASLAPGGELASSSS